MNAVVVGAGLAGVVAALELAEKGARVAVLRAGGGATALGGGTFDTVAAPTHVAVLRRSDGALRTPREHLAALLEQAPAHPYRVLLDERGKKMGDGAKDPLAGGRRQLDRALASAGLATDGSLETSLWLLDTSGALRLTDLAIHSVARGCLRSADGFEGLTLPLLSGLEGWDAAALARRVGAELHALGEPSRPVHLSTTPLRGPLREFGGNAARWAHHLETRETLVALARALAEDAGPGRLLLLPPILGIDRHAWVLAELERELHRHGAAGAAFAELVGIPPFHLMGTRTDRALRGALAAAAIDVIEGRADRVEAKAGRITSVSFETAAGTRDSLPVAAAVFATGRFLAGGLRAGSGGLEEPILGLPLYDARGHRCDGLPPRALTHADYQAEQRLYQAGVTTDSTLRPLRASGAPAFENLFVAGDLLGGFDPARDRNGYGVALASGFCAAQEVLRYLELGPEETV